MKPIPRSGKDVGQALASIAPIAPNSVAVGGYRSDWPPSPRGPEAPAATGKQACFLRIILKLKMYLLHRNRQNTSRIAAPLVLTPIFARGSDELPRSSRDGERSAVSLVTT